MRYAFLVLMALHALVHLMGFVKAFELLKVPQLKHGISPAGGLLWLGAALLILSSLIALNTWPKWWWALAAAALVFSQAAIATSWEDAKFGSLLNVVLLLGVVYGFLTQGPESFRAEVERDVARGDAIPRETRVVTEADLAPLPAPIQHYLRATGAVGKPRVRNYRVRFKGRMRSGPDAAWMPFEAEQQSFVEPPRRSFLMRATRSGLPVEALHRLAEGAASMRVRLLGAFTMVNASGPVMDRSETVTLFNDMCILAPGTLIEPSIRWQLLDARRVGASFTHGANTVAATLEFDADGLLSNFTSDDRSRSSPDGRTFFRQRFSTPVRGYREYGAHKLASYGEAHYHPPEGEFAYGEFHMLDVEFNVPNPGAAR